MNALSRCRVLIADDQAHCLEALQLALQGRIGIEICGEAPGGRQMVEQAGQLEPDVIITDLRMPEMDGIEATRIVKEVHPQIKILALTQHSDATLIIDMTRAGANGYLMKNVEGDVLEEAVTTVMNGLPYFCKSTTLILQQMLKKGLLANPFKPLPPHFFATHEKEVLVLMCQGLITKQIAGVLGLSHNTVSKYRQNLMDKTGMRNEVSLAMFAVLHGVYTPGGNPL